MLDDARKEVDRVIESQAKLICLQWAQRGDGEPIRGKASTSSPSVRTSVFPPKLGTAEYEGIREYFNETPEQVFDLSWPKLRKLVTAINEKGDPLPDCLANLPSETKYGVTSRPKS